jgi:hypothetical protein
LPRAEEEGFAARVFESLGITVDDGHLTRTLGEALEHERTPCQVTDCH